MPKTKGISNIVAIDVLTELSHIVDRISLHCLGYRLSRQRAMEHHIAQLARTWLIIKNPNAEAELRKELDNYHKFVEAHSPFKWEV